jgi:hypothetical protein
MGKGKVQETMVSSSHVEATYASHTSNLQIAIGMQPVHLGRLLHLHEQSPNYLQFIFP